MRPIRTHAALAAAVIACGVLVAAAARRPTQPILYPSAVAVADCSGHAEIQFAVDRWHPATREWEPVDDHVKVLVLGRGGVPGRVGWWPVATSSAGPQGEGSVDVSDPATRPFQFRVKIIAPGTPSDGTLSLVNTFGDGPPCN